MIPRGIKVRRLHKAFLRYHDANNWPMLRAALKRMGREDLIGNGKQQLVPRFQPRGTGKAPEGKRAARVQAVPYAARALKRAGPAARFSAPWARSMSGVLGRGGARRRTERNG